MGNKMHSRVVAIGFLFLALFMFLIGAILAVVMQLELSEPGLQVISPATYHHSVNYHGLFMLYGVVIPAFIGLVIWYLPGVLAAENILIPKAGYLYGFIYVAGIVVLIAGGVIDLQKEPQLGSWNYYGNVEQNTSVLSNLISAESGLLLTAIALLLIMLSLMLTVLFKRDKSGFFSLPPLAWSVLVLASLTIVPLLIYLYSGINDLFYPQPEHSYESMMLAEPGYLSLRHLETPLIFLILMFGLNLRTFVSGENARTSNGLANVMIVLMAALFVSGWILGLTFDTGVPVDPLLFTIQAFLYIFAAMVYLAGYTLLLISLVKRQVRFGPHILFITFSYVFVLVAVIMSVMLTIAPIDFHYHDSWFVNGYQHYALFGGVMFSIFAAIYVMLLQWRTSLIASVLGYTHFTLTLFTVISLFWSYTVLGLAGMPMKFPDYSFQFEVIHSTNTVITFVLLSAQLFFIAVIVSSFFGRKQDL